MGFWRNPLSFWNSVPSALMQAGWVYRDVPRAISPELWDDLIGVFGDDDVQVLGTTEVRSGEDVVSIRGQLLISPEGLEKLRTHRLAVHRLIEI